jgi:tetratricopeptide (TPR) repeat protein
VNLIKDEIDNKEVIPLNEWKTGKTEEWQTGSKDKMKQCITQMDARTAALVARDWPQLERFAKRYLQDCKGVFDSENYSYAYEDIAMANMELNNPAAALEASERCIDVYYANAGCHVTKVRALAKLLRLSEARSEFEIAERLIVHLIEINEENLHKTSDPSEYGIALRKVYSSKGNKLRALQKLLDSIR